MNHVCTVEWKAESIQCDVGWKLQEKGNKNCNNSSY